jgi:hypothetical protein
MLNSSALLYRAFEMFTKKSKKVELTGFVTVNQNYYDNSIEFNFILKNFIIQFFCLLKYQKNNQPGAN